MLYHTVLFILSIYLSEMLAISSYYQMKKVWLPDEV